MVHVSELRWSRVADPHEVVTLGQEVTVKLLRMEEAEKGLKISLSIKQAEAGPADPWDQIGQKFPVGTALRGRVERREPYGIFGGSSRTGWSAFCRNPIHSRTRISVRQDLMRGDEIPVQIAELRLSEHRISLTLPQDPDRDEWRKHTPAPSSAGSFGTLADKLKVAMETSGGSGKKNKESSGKK